MDLNIFSILFLSYKIAPFIIISYLCLSTLFNHEYKGLVLLSGVLLSCFITTLVSKVPIFDKEPPDTEVEYCHTMTLTKANGPFSKLPLSMHIYTFIMVYFTFCVVYNSIVSENILTIIILSLLILVDIWFLTRYKCARIINMFVSIVLGFITGIMWFYIIGSSNNPDLQFFTGKSSEETCKVSNRQFSCRIVSG